MLCSDDGYHDHGHITYDYGCSESVHSLCCGRAKEDVSHGLRLQIDEDLTDGKKLRDTRVLNLNDENTEARKLKRLTEECENVSSGDEVEAHAFPSREEHFIGTYSGGEIGGETAGDSHKQRCVRRQEHTCKCLLKNRSDDPAWSIIHKEVEALHCFQNKSSISRTTNSHKGNWGKSKPKFSIRRLSWPSIQRQNGQHLELAEHGTSEHSIADLLEGLVTENIASTNSINVCKGFLKLDHRGTVDSVSELLEVFQENNFVNTRVRRKSRLAKRASCSIGNRILDDEDPLPPNDSGLSSEDEEVLIPSDTENAKAFPSGKYLKIEYYGQLQQILQMEKGRERIFLKKLQKGLSAEDASRCLDVQILSRSFDAKLIVCDYLINEGNNTNCAKGCKELVDRDGQVIQTAIFNPKMCGHVELEAGNFIRVHPPWKKVNVPGKGQIILCSFYSQLFG